MCVMNAIAHKESNNENKNKNTEKGREAEALTGQNKPSHTWNKGQNKPVTTPLVSTILRRQRTPF